MILSDKNIKRMERLIILGMASGLAGMMYFGRTAPEEKLMQKLNKEEVTITHDLVNCVPRDRKTSISDFCIYSAQQYDSLGKKIETVESSPAYISAQRNRLYSIGFTYLLMLSFAGYVYLDRKEKENQPPAKGEQ